MAQIRTFPGKIARQAEPEPLLSDLIDDPITQAVMRRDGVTREGLIRILEIARKRMAAQTLITRCCA